MKYHEINLALLEGSSENAGPRANREELHPHSGYRIGSSLHHPSSAAWPVLPLSALPGEILSRRCAMGQKILNASNLS